MSKLMQHFIGPFCPNGFDCRNPNPFVAGEFQPGPDEFPLAADLEASQVVEHHKCVAATGNTHSCPPLPSHFKWYAAYGQVANRPHSQTVAQETTVYLPGDTATTALRPQPENAFQPVERPWLGLAHHTVNDEGD